MKYCTNCHRLTAGEPLYCNTCGRSFDLRLCQSRHLNPRSAEVCSTCGSRDLSTPQPHLPFWFAPFVWLLSALPGILLLVISVMFLLALVEALIQHQQLVFGYVASFSIILGLLWLMYIHLPGFIRSLIRRLFTRSKGGSQHGH